MPLKCFGKPTSQSLSQNGAVHPDRPAHPNNRQNQSVDISFSTVDIAPNRAVTRSGMGWHGMGVELVQSMTHERVDHSFYSPLHLLAAYQHGVRRDGESCVEGVPRSPVNDHHNRPERGSRSCRQH